MAETDHPNGTCGIFCPYCKEGVPRTLEAVRRYEAMLVLRQTLDEIARGYIFDRFTEEAVRTQMEIHGIPEDDWYFDAEKRELVVRVALLPEQITVQVSRHAAGYIAAMDENEQDEKTSIDQADRPIVSEPGDGNTHVETAPGSSFAVPTDNIPEGTAPEDIPAAVTPATEQKSVDGPVDVQQGSTFVHGPQPEEVIPRPNGPIAQPEGTIEGANPEGTPARGETVDDAAANEGRLADGEDASDLR